MRNDDFRSPLESRRRKSVARNWVPVLMIVGIVAFVASREVPVVRDAVERLLAPEKWRAETACAQAALRLSTKPAFARIVQPGRVHATQDGFYVEAIRVGEMGARGGESLFGVACYTNATGQVVRADRLSTLEPAHQTPGPPALGANRS